MYRYSFIEDVITFGRFKDKTVESCIQSIFPEEDRGFNDYYNWAYANNIMCFDDLAKIALNNKRIECIAYLCISDRINDSDERIQSILKILK